MSQELYAFAFAVGSVLLLAILVKLYLWGLDWFTRGDKKDGN